MTLFTVENLRVRRGEFETRLPRLEIAPGTVTALVGPSGSGKTTLLEAIAGFVPTLSADVRLGEQKLDSLPVEKRKIAFAFQRPVLFPFLDVAGNIAFGLRLAGKSAREQREAASFWLDRMELSGLEERPARALSEGQIQRVALARALAVGFPVLFLDEPFSALDPQTRGRLRGDLGEWIRQHGIHALLVSHHPEDVESLATRVGQVDRGVWHF